MKVGSKRFNTHLAQHQGDLSAMVRRMIRDMLHELNEWNVDRAIRQQTVQAFVCDSFDNRDRDRARRHR